MFCSLLVFKKGSPCLEIAFFAASRAFLKRLNACNIGIIWGNIRLYRDNGKQNGSTQPAIIYYNILYTIIHHNILSYAICVLYTVKYIYIYTVLTEVVSE